MKLYNTPRRQVETIRPVNGQAVGVYTCGPTVYDEPHIGNWFTFLRYDLLIRALRLSGLQPTWVMNITDVGHLTSDADEGEDKLEKGARRENKTSWEVAAAYTQSFLDGMAALNMLEPDHLPKATEHINDQIALIQRLEAGGYTYTIADGVYFDTAKFPGYADFAKLDVAGLAAGARVAANPDKRNITDFALWKLSPPGSRRDMEWDSPWGKGWPGWHLECSAMSMKYLGETIDIHGGGIDHIPVHHTNEIAQSEAATGRQFVRYWFHANHVLVDGAKIAKSAGNGITLADVVATGYRPEVLRLLVLESHYRTQSVFSWTALAAAASRLNDLEAMADLQHQASPSAGQLEPDYWEKVNQDIKQALLNDLNTPQALAIISQVAGQLYANGGLSSTNQPAFADWLALLDAALGLRLRQRPDIDSHQRELLDRRQAARQQQNWPEADRLRQELSQQGLGVRDTTDGWQWYRLS